MLDAAQDKQDDLQIEDGHKVRLVYDTRTNKFRLDICLRFAICASMS